MLTLRSASTRSSDPAPTTHSCVRKLVSDLRVYVGACGWRKAASTPLEATVFRATSPDGLRGVNSCERAQHCRGSPLKYDFKERGSWDAVVLQLCVIGLRERRQRGLGVSPASSSRGKFRLSIRSSHVLRRVRA